MEELTKFYSALKAKSEIPTLVNITNTNQFDLILKIILRHLPLFILLLSADFTGYSQEVKLLEGQIFSDSLSPANIHIINLNLEKGTTSGNFGSFNIYAKIGDSLLFSSVQFENRKIIISRAEINSGRIEIKLFPARNELDEVQISDLKLSGYLNNDISKIKFLDRKKFGIPYPEKQLSQTERRLYTANAGIKSRWAYIGVLFGNVPLDVVINDINGKTKYLKKLDKQDKLQIRVQNGIDVLGKSFFISELKLPEGEIENFVYYCARHADFQIIIESNNQLDLIELYKGKRQAFINLRQLNDPIEN